MKKFKRLLIFLAIITICCLIFSIPELRHHNEGESKAIGSVRNGNLKNGWLVPYSGANFRYFSPFSYYLLNNGYTHSKVYRTILQAYESCAQSCPGVQFKIMECSNWDGGKMLIHRTHRNGMSVDFMVPKRNGKTQSTFFDKFGIWHYLLEFNDEGKLKVNKNVQLDFESIGKHILAVDDAARQNGLRIRKIIFKIELMDELFASSSGAELQRRDIYFVQRLSNIVNKVHDDHYHIDFEEVK